MQTCHSITGCTEAARHTERDEKYSLCGLPNWDEREGGGEAAEIRGDEGRDTAGCTRDTDDDF